MSKNVDVVQAQSTAPLDPGNLTSFQELLRFRAKHEPDQCAYVFLADGDTDQRTITYGQLDAQARAIAARLQSLGLRDERVILFHPSGLEFIAAFFGCLYAGSVAVPAFPPRPRRSNQRLSAILSDCDARAVLGTQAMSEQLNGSLSSLVDPGRLPFVETDAVPPNEAEAWQDRLASPDALAFLQYTSGSTGTPKGVMVRHFNLMDNASYISASFGCRPSDLGLFWLPSFHDMGLIGGILQPLYSGRPSILMPPVSFIERPLRWLKAISKYGATMSGGPNFAYDLCVQKIAPEKLKDLDLSRWRLAFSGSEPIRAETLDQFVEKFAPCGFRREAFYPCYGLAEATLLVSGSVPSEPPVLRESTVLTPAGEQQPNGNGKSNRANLLVGCGKADADHRVMIVDPNELTPCDENQVGEIWVAGASIAGGYWNRNDESEQVFRAYLKGSGEGPFLRTGDLGFLSGGELFVTGRLKDLIIIRGTNYYPQDIEATIEKCDRAIRGSGVAAFAVAGDQGEQAFVVMEIERPIKRDYQALIDAARRATTEEHDLQLHGVTVIKPGKLPKTSSGKVQRSACREALLNGTFEGVLAQWSADSLPELPTTQSDASDANGASATASPAVESAPDETEAAKSDHPWNPSGVAKQFANGEPGQDLGAASIDVPEVASSDHPGDHAPIKPGEPLAIVGMACRFPGARDVSEFLDLLRESKSGIREVSPDRWDADQYHDPDPDAPGKMVTRWAGFVDEIDQFDADFFGITPREANRMDPQQRMLAEVSWQALENAGIAVDQIAGSRTGVFVGIGGSDYSTLQMSFDRHISKIDAYTGTGNAHSIAANRLSYLFDLRGPSLAIDTACSSSLVALHYACQSIRNDECDMSVVAGVNLILTPEVSVAFSKARMLSADGRCKPFDAEANGYVRGEGCGVVVVKRLADAEAAGDHVLAIIRGTAVNQDGHTSGITAPNPESQEAVIRRALAESGITADQLSYIEAHGTGTPLGDPIEASALKAVIGSRGEGQTDCYFGSVKGNVGHLETASGVAGLAKIVLMLSQEQIFPQVNFQSLNPQISLDDSALKLPLEQRPWEPIDGRRLAGLNSFGFGGTNAHVVIEGPASKAAPKPPVDETADEPEERPAHVLTLSSRSGTALKRLAELYIKELAHDAQHTLADVCFSANTGRSQLPHRMAVYGESTFEVCERLQEFLDGESPAGVLTGQLKSYDRPKVALLCTGQGSQYTGMGEALYRTQPTFRQHMQQCDELLRPHLDQPLVDVLYPRPGEKSPIHETAYTQPALFALEWSLAQLWLSWGVQPDALLGHSIGEYVAAALAGVFSLEDGLKLIAARGRLMQALPRDGSMAVLLAPEAQVAPVVAEHDSEVSIAAVNGPHAVVISGKTAAVDEIIARLNDEGVASQKLQVSHAFHSPLMDPMLDAFDKVAAKVDYQAPRIPLISNLTGEVLPADSIPNAAYWRQHIREAVRFESGMKALAGLDCDVFLEVGPSPTLLNMGKHCVPPNTATWLTTLRKGQDDWQQVLNSLSELYVHGVRLDWRGFDRDYPRRRGTLPNYPFERKRYWMKSDGDEDGADDGDLLAPCGASVHPLLGYPLRSALQMQQFESRLSLRSSAYLADHKVQGDVIVPGAAYLETALAAAREAFGPGRQMLENVVFQHPIFLAEKGTTLVQLVQLAEVGGRSMFQLYSQPAPGAGKASNWTLNVTGTMTNVQAEDTAADERIVDLDELRARCTDSIESADFYQRLAQRGLQYGPRFQGVEELWQGDSEALGHVVPPPAVAAEQGSYLLHPAVLDASFHVLAAAIREAAGTASGDTYMPVGVKAIRFFQQPDKSLWVHARLAATDHDGAGDSLEGDITLVTDTGQVVAEVERLRLQRLGSSSSAGDSGAATSWTDWLYEVNWKSLKPLPRPDATEKMPRDRRGTWILYADQAGIAERLAKQLDARGNQCVLVTPGDAAAAVDTRHFTCPVDRPDAAWELLASSAEDRPRVCGVVHLWGLDTPAAGEPLSLDQLDAAQQLGCISAAKAMQPLVKNASSHHPAFWLTTRGVHQINQEPVQVAVANAGLWGLARVAMREHPEVKTAVIDLCPDGKLDEVAEALFKDIWYQDYEDQIAVRGRERWSARVNRYSAGELDGEPETSGSRWTSLISSGQPYRLEIDGAGTLEGLSLRPTNRAEVAPDQVEVEVRAAGLNFSDVLKAIGLYPGITDTVVPLGIECSGVVSAVGAEVEGVEIGDEVIALAPYCFGKYAVTPAYGVVPKPKHLSFAEAATIPVTFMTAWYALCYLGRIRKGERVLIHAAAGGVGQAAIQIAQAVGAEIFATAGTPEKRAFLASQGVQHVFDSRTLDFAGQILDITDRQGVDLVLNSLAGEAIPKSLDVLGAYGRFLEIGKTDIYQNRMMGLQPFQDNLSYYAIDMDRMFRQRPDVIRELFAQLMPNFEQQKFTPLPAVEFPLVEAVDAFRYMMQRKNTGKIVVSLSSESVDAACPEETGTIRSGATYLITGGTGSLGQHLCRWLTDQGAKHLAILSRSGPSEAAAAQIAELRSAGTRVEILQADVADADQLAEALATIDQSMPALAGVIHAAGSLDDALIVQLEKSHFDSVLAPKVHGAWNLHQLTRERPLDLFVMFSSATGVLGGEGQANYAAANAFLDALAHERRQAGLPATSIDWGPWQSSGMASQAARIEAMARRGVLEMPVNQALAALDRLLKSPLPQLMVAQMNWSDALRLYADRPPPLVCDLADSEGVGAGSAVVSDDALLERLLEASADQRLPMLTAHFLATLAKVTGQDPSRIDCKEPIRNLGLDSLMAIELKNAIESSMDITISIATLFQDPSLEQLAEHALEVWEARHAAGSSTSTSTLPTD